MCLLFCYCVIQGVSFNYHHRNVRSRVSVSVSNFQVSVSAFMTKSRSRLEIWARSRSRRLRSRLHHWYTQNIIKYALKVRYFAKNIDAWVVACKNRIMHLSVGEGNIVVWLLFHCNRYMHKSVVTISCLPQKPITGSLNNVHFIPFFLSLLTI